MHTPNYLKIYGWLHTQLLESLGYMAFYFLYTASRRHHDFELQITDNI